MTLAKKYVGTAENSLRKADREYAYYMSGAQGDPQQHYLISQQEYSKARDLAHEALEIMKEKNYDNLDLMDRINAILEKCDR